MPEIAQAGDIVTCIEGRRNLTVGAKYKVHGIVQTFGELCYKLTGDDGTQHCTFYVSRFELSEAAATREGAIEYEEAMAAQDIMDNLNA